MVNFTWRKSDGHKTLCHSEPAVATDNDLPYFAVITAEFNCRFVNHRLRIFTLVVGDSNPFPGLKILRLLDKFMAPPPEGDEPDFLVVEFGEIFVGGQFGIKDECRFHRLFDALPEGEEGENLIIGLTALNVCGGKKNKPALGILCQESKGSFHPFPPGAGPVFLENRFVTEVRDGVEIKVDDRTGTDAQIKINP